MMQVFLACYGENWRYDWRKGQNCSDDPIGLNGGINLYGYAPNPLSWIDPLGLFCGVAKNAKWNKSRQGVEGPGLRDHYAKHGDQVGAGSVREYDFSARTTIQDGRKFTYRDRYTNKPRVGYYDPNTGLFTATSQTGKTPTILTHFPESWDNLRKSPGFSVPNQRG